MMSNSPRGIKKFHRRRRAHTRRVARPHRPQNNANLEDVRVCYQFFSGRKWEKCS